MKKIQFLIFASVLAVIFSACKGGEAKVDPGATENSGADVKADTVAVENNEINAERNTGDKLPKASAPAAKPDSMAKGAGSNEIIARIDNYLVSTGNLATSTVTIKNTLPSITFQKAIVEVTLLGADGKTIRSDYFTIQNIEPGDTETIKLPNTAKATSMVTHVVKVKSNALTNGEMVLSGTHYEEGK